MLIYRKKPVDLKVVRWTGENVDEVQEFLRDGSQYPAGWVKGMYVDIGTQFGLRVASVGDYIICEPGAPGCSSKFYPCTETELKSGYFELCP